MAARRVESPSLVDFFLPIREWFGTRVDSGVLIDARSCIGKTLRVEQRGITAGVLPNNRSSEVFLHIQMCSPAAFLYKCQDRINDWSRRTGQPPDLLHGGD
jgi:hypothetical protein